MSYDLNVFFFFSSRRRHTRYWRDWSSDVCSSDLFRPRVTVRFECVRSAEPPTVWSVASLITCRAISEAFRVATFEIGRASCREKSVDLGGRRIIKKKKKTIQS